MPAIRVIGEVDRHHHLMATVPESIAPGSIEILLIPRESEEDDAGSNWMAGIAEEWRNELNDPREDIYSLTDGVPVDEPR